MSKETNEERVWLTAVESTVRSWCRVQFTTVREITGRSSVLISIYLRRTKAVAIARLDFSCPWGCGIFSRDRLAHQLAKRLGGLMAPGAKIGIDGLRAKTEGS